MADKAQVSTDFFNIPIPPSDLKKPFNYRIIETLFNDLAGIASHNRVGRDIFNNHSSCSDNGAVSYSHTVFDLPARANLAL